MINFNIGKKLINLINCSIDKDLEKELKVNMKIKNNYLSKSKLQLGSELLAIDYKLYFTKSFLNIFEKIIITILLIAITSYTREGDLPFILFISLIIITIIITILYIIINRRNFTFYNYKLIIENQLKNLNDKNDGAL